MAARSLWPMQNSHDHSGPALSRGAGAERRAETYLSEHGLRPLERNFRSRFGEIDLIMEEGSTLVFIEVRQRKNDRFGSAAESVSTQKQNKLRKTVDYYLMHNPSYLNVNMRFDVVAISGSLPHARIDWYKNAF